MKLPQPIRPVRTQTSGGTSVGALVRLSASDCVSGEMRCNGTAGFDICDHGQWIRRLCAPGTACQPMGSSIMCA